MKKTIVLALALLSVTLTGSRARAAGSDATPPADARFLMHLTTDATTSTCDLYVSVDGSNELTGAIYACSTNPNTFNRYTLDQLKAGIVFSKSVMMETLSPAIAPAFATTLVTISAPNVDPSQGGAVNAHYISNGILGTYDDYGFQLALDSGAWAAYTTAANGSERFDQLFMKKKTSFGATIGVSCVSVSLSPATPGDCSN